MSSHYPECVNNIIEEFKKMPGIGPKSAQRLVFYLLGITDKDAKNLSDLIMEVKTKIKYCLSCHNISTDKICGICADDKRSKDVLCVVAEPKSLIAIEKTKEFKGLYHILGGVISPLDGIGPDALRIKELLTRLKNGVKEVIIALNPTTESEATVFYLTKLIKPLGIKLTRIAYGLPIGSDIDYADEATLSKSMEGRTQL